MTRTSGLVAAAAMVAVGGGCVSKAQYGGLEEAYRAQRQHAEAMRATIERQTRENQGLRLQMQAKDGYIEKLESDNDVLRNTNVRKAEVQNVREDTTGAAIQRVAEEKDSGIEYDAANRKLTLSAAIFFNPGDAGVRPEARATLARVAKVLSDAGSKIHCVGHTDSDPIVKTKDKWPHGNWQLSGARALAVLLVLSDEGRLDADRLSYEGRGSHDPVAPNTTPENKKKNRRVEIFLREA